MGALLHFLVVSALVPLAVANRTSCFAYIDCYERAQIHLKDCVGGTAMALTVEAKDRTAADLVRGRGAVFSGCQDRLARELIDFDTLQVLTLEDARECFEKLPGSGKRVAFNVATCPSYSPVKARDNYGKETSECVIEYYNDRQKCEQLLDCCPDHTRCGERMNAVSVSYQHGKAKGLQIVSNMLKCVASTDPSAAFAISNLQNQRSSLRNAGLPFFRPDMATEERITRRLSLTSTASIEQRKQRFNRRYHQIRSLLSQRIHQATIEIARSTTPSASAPTTTLPSERRIAIIRNLLRNADDHEMATYVSLIADGDFEKLSALEQEKVVKNEGEAQVDEATKKMAKIRDAIKAALATKEQKTLNFLETSGSTAERLALVALRQKENEDWDAEVPLSSIISKDLNGGEIDSETLFRAKKFANALGEVLQAQKELLLSDKDSFTGNGLPSSRTSSKAPPTDERKPHDFNTLTHTLRAGTVVSSDTEAATTTGAPSTDAATEAPTTEVATDALVTEAATEAPTTEAATEVTTATETAATETSAPLTEEFVTILPTTKPAPLPKAIMEMSSQPLTQSKMISIVQPKEGAVEMIKATADETRAASEILVELEAKVNKGHDQPEVEKKSEQEEPAQDKRAVDEIVAEVVEKVEGGSVDLKTLSALLKDGEVTTTEAVPTEATTTVDASTEPTTVEATTTIGAAATTSEIPVTEEETTHTTTEAATEATTTEDVTTEAATTTTEALTTTKKAKKPKSAKKSEPKKTSLNEKSKNLMKKVVRDMKKKIEKLRNKVETTTEAAPTTISADERPSLEVEPLTEAIEGSGMETTTPVAEAPKKEKKKILRDQGVNHCVSHANCDDMVRDYQEQCDRRFSIEIISHGIEESEIVEALRNATISHNDIVLRACLRPLDKSAYANLKQLLAIQRGVRRACLELGRNRPVLSDEQSAVCHSPLPSTESLDEFLAKTHSRSEETHTLCLAKLAPLKETCQAIAGCCASVNACDNYIAASPVKQLRDEATAVLVQRQHACEERMLETLKYIQKKLTSRRRRV